MRSQLQTNQQRDSQTLPSIEVERGPSQPDRQTTQQLSPDRQTTPSSRNRTAKVKDPNTFTRTELFRNWETQVYSKLEVNTDYFDTEAAKMYLVYSATSGDARDYLYPQYKHDAPNRFISAI